MINVVGMGYIGLPTAVMLCCADNCVVGTDIDKKLVDRLKKGELPFEERGFNHYFKKSIEKGLKFSVSIKQASMYIVAVPTPYLKEEKR